MDTHHRHTNNSFSQKRNDDKLPHTLTVNTPGAAFITCGYAAITGLGANRAAGVPNGVCGYGL